MKVGSKIFVAWAALVANILTLAMTAQTAVAQGSTNWTEGRNYFLVTPARPTSVGPGKVEVTEVFSYGCPACNLFLPTMHKLIKALPPNAVVTYIPAAFNPGEDWPMFQLAYYTAQTLGVAEQAHDAMFDAVWNTGEMAIEDPASRSIKSHLPTIEDAARFYNRHAGVPIDKFLAASKSFSVDVKVRAAEDAMVAYRIDRTPTLIVNGKYRLQVESAGGDEQVIELVKWLVAKESK
jgi:protein dithiol oxidoreductase (disulfide-forming)